MRKISTVILTDEFSTAEVLKLFLSEFDNLDIIEAAHNSSEILKKNRCLLLIYLTEPLKNWI